MNCVTCQLKSCRDTRSCGAEKFDRTAAAAFYAEPENGDILQAAARLVDGGRAGTLSRIEEVMEFAKDRGYRKVGLAYCYGMEALAKDVYTLIRGSGLAATAVSCTAGAMAQKDLNRESDLPGVSCNPISQAMQLKAEGVDFAVVMGLCLGHDILFQKQFSGDQTTLVVKDRTSAHDPVKSIRRLAEKS